MKKTKQNEVHITKIAPFGQLPPFIGLAHRHFEKERPLGSMITNNATLTEKGVYIVPVDLAAMVLPPDYIEGIDSIELYYERSWA